MYQKMSDDCKRSLRKQFGFSSSELNQMEKFMECNLNKTTSDILVILMKDTDLNDRQKVIVSYTLGATVGAESVVKELEGSNMAKVDPMVGMKIGQGG